MVLLLCEQKCHTSTIPHFKLGLATYWLETISTHFLLQLCFTHFLPFFLTHFIPFSLLPLLRVEPGTLHWAISFPQYWYHPHAKPFPVLLLKLPKLNLNLLIYIILRIQYQILYRVQSFTSWFYKPYSHFYYFLSNWYFMCWFFSYLYASVVNIWVQLRNQTFLCISSKVRVI